MTQNPEPERSRPFGEITRALKDLNDDKAESFDRLYALVRDDLHRVARGILYHESPACPLETTDLVDEALIKTVLQPEMDWSHRRHFFAAVGRAMRQTLVDAARARQALKRGGRGNRVDLESSIAVYNHDPILLLTIDEALDALNGINPRAVQVVHLHFFAERTLEETASFLSVSLRTISRDWDFAKAWIGRALLA